jgi:hypothetical protein
MQTWVFHFAKIGVFNFGVVTFVDKKKIRILCFRDVNGYVSVNKIMVR